MANLPEKIITTVDKITEIPSNTMIFVNADGVFNQASIDDIVRASNVITDSIANQFKKAIGAEILATNSSAGNFIDFSADGRSEQIVSNFFDGELLQGHYSTNTGAYNSNSATTICSANILRCNPTDAITVTYEETSIAGIWITFYDANKTFLSYSSATTNKLEAETPANAYYFHFTVQANSDITPTTAKEIAVTINGVEAAINPSYPQDIKSVGDKGWFDGELLANMSTANSTGVIGVNNGYVLSKNYIPCNGGDTVKVIYEEVARVIRVSFYDSTKAHISTSYLTNITEFEKVAPTNSTYFLFSISNTNSDITPQTAKKIVVTINDTYALKVKKVNKNLWEFGDVSGTTSKIITLGKALPQGTYTLSSLVTSSDTDSTKNRIVLYSEDLQQSLNVDIGRNTRTSTTFTITFDVKTIRFWGGSGSSTSSGDTFAYADIQLEFGNTMTTYVPHEEQTTYIPLTQPLRGIGDVKDSVKKVDGLYGENRKFAKVVFDGSDDEGWSAWGTSYPNAFYHSLASLGLAKNSTVLCSHYSQITSSEINIVDYGIATQDYLTIKDIDCSSTDELKTKLASNPITMIAELAEETFTPFADQTPFYQMQTFDEVTYITNADDANMEVEYPTSKTAGIASIGFAKGNLADIKIEQLSAKLLEVQTALLNV